MNFNEFFSENNECSWQMNNDTHFNELFHGIKVKTWFCFSSKFTITNDIHSKYDKHLNDTDDTFIKHLTDTDILKFYPSFQMTEMNILWHRCWTRGVAVWYIVHVTIHTRIFLLSINTIVRLKSCRETFRPLTRNTIMLLAILQIERGYAADERIARVTVSQ